MTTTTHKPQISVSGTTTILQAPLSLSIEEGHRLWQMTVQNDEKPALIYFKSGLSEETVEKVAELLVNGAEVRFYGTVDFDKVMVTEMYLNLNEPMVLAI